MAGSASYTKDVSVYQDVKPDKIYNSTIAMKTQIIIKAGGRTFGGTLADSPTAGAFRAMLPLEISMTELNANEKFYRLSKNLPVNPAVPPIIQNGDLMLFGSNTLVLFYKTFSTTYSYTRIGRINDASGLAEVLGSDNKTIRFELP
ncbi:cyclophilin-like fold protein [Emticicia fluvialis]|uniref:cyclophilin-like fold protein n=1 Tax=Emticicia fluvialis TaxID=2974474 RepID=UPI0021652181|nr:cyclophilin-like fold protein [Emticicia fluvialis]